VEKMEMFSGSTRVVTHQYLGRDGRRYSVEEEVLSEYRFCVSVNGRTKLELVCLPQFLQELILGRLLTEGVISSVDEVAELKISETEVEVTLTHDWDGTCGPLRPVKPMAWKPEWVFGLADRFAQGMPVHSRTFATHSCFLAKGDMVLFMCEDIGRHNALDKAVGYALCHRIPLEECLLYSSGRMPVDMVSKAIRAGIPLLSGKGSPTAEAVELARQYGLTLICGARRDRMKQFAGVEPQI